MINQPVILITGASSGIGEASARLFAREGYRMSLGARRIDRLESLAGEIEIAGGQALATQSDLTRMGDIKNLVSRTLDRFGRIDVLFNNAGFGRLDWCEDLDPVRDVEAQLQINLVATILVSREVLPHMIKQRSGHIINMASLGGYVATPTYTVYAASKFGVRGFTEALRREVSVFGIHVSGIYPGGVSTEFKQHTGAQRKTGWTTPASLRLTPEEVAQGVFSVVRRPKRSLILPWPMRFVVWMNILFPGIVDWVIERRFTRLEREI